MCYVHGAWSILGTEGFRLSNVGEIKVSRMHCTAGTIYPRKKGLREEHKLRRSGTRDLASHLRWCIACVVTKDEEPGVTVEATFSMEAHVIAAARFTFYYL